MNTDNDLQAMFYNDQTDLLLCMIPFIPANLQLPLLYLLKINELKTLTKRLSHPTTLTATSNPLSSTTFDIDTLLHQMSLSNNPRLKQQADSIKGIYDTIKMTESMMATEPMNFASANQPANSSVNIDANINSPSHESFEEKLNRLIKDYEKEMKKEDNNYGSKMDEPSSIKTYSSGEVPNSKRNY